jgi:hypothetical protein
VQIAGKTTTLALDAGGDALHGGAEVVGGDGGVNSQTGKVIPGVVALAKTENHLARRLSWYE